METLQEDVPLRDSLLWPLIEAFYGEQGPQAFDETPYYPTNNAYLAGVYVDLIIAFYLDLPETAEEKHAPAYIVEWAAGAGVLGFLILQRLEVAWNRHSRLKGRRWVYVLTDFTEKNVEAWQADEQLQPWVAKGSLDFARFKPESDEALELREAKTRLRPGDFGLPPLVIANYFFDSIRQDFLRFDRGHFLEARIRVQQRGPVTSPKPGALLAELQLKERWVPANAALLYPEASLNGVVRALGERQPDSTFLFPLSGLRALENWRRIAKGRFGFLMADKGFSRPEFTAGSQTLPYTPHTGSFSFMVNFPAVALWFAQQGGTSVTGPENPPLMCFAGELAGLSTEGSFHHLAQALVANSALPQTLQSLPAWLSATVLPESPPIERWRGRVAALRLASFDPWVTHLCGPELCDAYSKDEYTMRTELPEVLERAAAPLHRRAVGAPEALRQLRRLAFVGGRPEDCLRFNRSFQAWFGEDRDTWFYPAAIAEARGEWTKAIQGFSRALELDPGCTVTKEALRRSREKRGDKFEF